MRTFLSGGCVRVRACVRKHRTGVCACVLFCVCVCLDVCARVLTRGLDVCARVRVCLRGAWMCVPVCACAYEECGGRG